MRKNLEELIKNPTFCSMAWSHQFMDPTGRVKPCCRFEEIHRPPENNLADQSLKEVFEGPWMSNVREKMLRGEKVDGCKRCYQEQAAGKKSLRQRYNENITLPIEDLLNLQEPKIRWIELAISNNCNLACRMCDSRYSWKWFEEEQFVYDFTYSDKKLTKMNISEVDPYINSLVHLKFTGGEPLITPDHWKLLNKLLDQRNCKEIFLNYSTNCTIYPKKSWVEKWDQFKFVEFALSFDSANKKESEYIRWPSSFEDTEKTTLAFLDLSREHKFFNILRTTISLLNVWHLPETMIWWLDNDPAAKKRMNPTHLTHPALLSMTVLPSFKKKQIVDRYSKFMGSGYPKQLTDLLDYTIRYMNSKDDSHLLYNLKTYVNRTDKFRKQDFFQSYPMYSDIFDNIEAKNYGPHFKST